MELLQCFQLRKERTNAIKIGNQKVFDTKKKINEFSCNNKALLKQIAVPQKHNLVCSVLILWKWSVSTLGCNTVTIEWDLILQAVANLNRIKVLFLSFLCEQNQYPKCTVKTKSHKFIHGHIILCFLEECWKYCISPNLWRRTKRQVKSTPQTSSWNEGVVLHYTWPLAAVSCNQRYFLFHADNRACPTWDQSQENQSYTNNSLFRHKY